MTNREILEANCYDNVVIFDNPAYEGALIGVSQDNRAIYSWEKMIDCLVKEDGMTPDDAAEFIDYNTIRACDYIAGSPIIMYDLQV